MGINNRGRGRDRACVFGDPDSLQIVVSRPGAGQGIVEYLVDGIPVTGDEFRTILHLTGRVDSDPLERLGLALLDAIENLTAAIASRATTVVEVPS